MVALPKIGRLAILKPYRQYGFGRELMLAVHKWIETQISTRKAGRQADADEGVAMTAQAQLSAQVDCIPTGKLDGEG